MEDEAIFRFKTNRLLLLHSQNRNDVFKLFLLAILLAVFTNINAQNTTITIKMKNVRLSDILQEIKNQSGKSILYNNSFVDVYKNESITLNNVTLEEALKECLKIKSRVTLLSATRLSCRACYRCARLSLALVRPVALRLRLTADLPFRKLIRKYLSIISIPLFFCLSRV